MVIVPAWMRVMLASGFCFVAVGVSALYISGSTASWFASLQKPAFFNVPLEAIFFILIVSCGLISVASSLMWIHDPKQWDFRGWMPMFFSHLLVQSAWLILFFGYTVIFLSLIVSAFLSLFVLLLLISAWSRSRLAFWLLIPYLVWTLYAFGMNMAVWVAN